MAYGMTSQHHLPEKMSHVDMLRLSSCKNPFLSPPAASCPAWHHHCLSTLSLKDVATRNI